MDILGVLFATLRRSEVGCSLRLRPLDWEAGSYADPRRYRAAFPDLGRDSLKDDGIAYMTEMGPNDMRWLSFEDARSIGVAIERWPVN